MADEPAPPTRENLASRYRAQHTQGLALTLFDRTLPLHNLSDNSRHVLSIAALLYIWPFPYDPQQPLENVRHLIELEAFEEPTPEEIETLAYVLAIHHRHLNKKALAKTLLSPEYQRKIRTLAALLKIAVNLDNSKSQTTQIQRVEYVEGGLWLVVYGPYAREDARRANKAARVWCKIGYPKIKILDEIQAQAELLPYPEPVQSPGMTPTDSLAEAGRKVMLAQFAELLSHENGVRLGQDIEELHDMRVATRRLRASFEVFGEAFSKKTLRPHLVRLRALGRALGKVRDLDVLLEKAQAYRACLPDDHQDDLLPLIQHWLYQRQVALADLTTHLDSKQYQKFKHRFNLFVQTPITETTLQLSTSSPNRVNEIAPVLIYRRLAAVKTFETLFQGEPDMDRVPVERLHALRIEFKQLRYTVEYFREILGDESKPVVNDLKYMQDNLGDLHDAYIAVALLQQFLDQSAPNERAQLHGIVAYQEYRRDEFIHLKESTPQAWNYFNRPDFKLNLSLAMSIL